MGRDRRTKGHDTSRIGGGFIALPWQVVDSHAYMQLSFAAKALLIEIDRQYVRDNNGRLLATRAYLKKRGWNSQDVITRALRDLMAAKLIHQTVKGHRPNRASWFAVTWRNLDRIPGYDAGAAATFERGGFKSPGIENASLKPSSGLERTQIAPFSSLESGGLAPRSGVIKEFSHALPAPSDGHHLEQPSAEAALIQPRSYELHHECLSDSQINSVPKAVTRKAVTHLAKLPRGEHDEKVIRSARAAGLTIEQLIRWADAETVRKSLAEGPLPFRDLWTVVIDEPV